MINLELLYFKFTDEQEQAIEMGTEIDLSECEADVITFYGIDNLKPDGAFCRISSGGEDFIIAESYESVKEKIEAQINMFYKFLSN